MLGVLGLPDLQLLLIMLDQFVGLAVTAVLVDEVGLLHHHSSDVHLGLLAVVAVAHF